jgi:phosphoglycerate kinase
MRLIAEALDLAGKKALVRVDWNVPVKDGAVVDDFRIRQALPTIELLQKAGAEITLISHFTGEGDSLRYVAEHAKRYLPELAFNQEGRLRLMENLRLDDGEKDNSDEFSKKLSQYGDIYVNEAFSSSHRNHASIVGVPKLLPSYAGICFAREVQELSKAFYPKHPFLFILGGAKFDTKLPLLQKFAGIADDIFVGGALANNFFREMGRDVGESLVSEGDFGLKELLEGGKIMLPEDVIDIGGKILDAGPITIEKLKEKISNAKLILWNGPLGNYENGYKVATLALAKVIAESGKESIVGGGDTLGAIDELGVLDNFSFVSTGGGAMLDFLSAGTLPGIEALK